MSTTEQTNDLPPELDLGDGASIRAERQGDGTIVATLTVNGESLTATPEQWLAGIAEATVTR